MNSAHYIFVDYENIQKVDLSAIDGKPVVVFLVLGEHNKNLPITLVRELLRPSPQVRLIETGQSGRNALDFVLAYYVGVQTVAEPQAHYHILSRDKGFDALVHHLSAKGISVTRHEEFTTVPLSQGAVPSLAERVKRLAVHLRKQNTGRPKKEKTLRSSINAFFGKKLSEAEIGETIHGLCENGLIEMSETGAVTYNS